MLGLMWVRVLRYQVLGLGYHVLGLGHQVLGLGCQVLGLVLGYHVLDLGLGSQVLVNITRFYPASV